MKKLSLIQIFALLAVTPAIAQVSAPPSDDIEDAYKVCMAHRSSHASSGGYAATWHEGYEKCDGVLKLYADTKACITGRASPESGDPGSRSRIAGRPARRSGRGIGSKAS
jgi:hypothetical protein